MRKETNVEMIIGRHIQALVQGAKKKYSEYCQESE